MTADKTNNIFYEEGTPSSLSKQNCDTANIIPVNEMCIDSLEVTASPCVQVPQKVESSAREQCPLPCTIDVPLCNDLVDLSCTGSVDLQGEVNKEINKEPSVVVLNPDLEGLPYSVLTNPVHSVNSITFELHNNCPFLQGQISGIPTSLLCDTGASVTTISENLFSKIPNRMHMRNNNTFQQDIRTVSGESMPIKGVALVPSQTGEYNYTFYVYIIENLAYNAILVSDFLGHYQSVIDFDNHSLRLLPPGEKPPPYPGLTLSCSVHAHKTCVLPSTTEFIIPATLKCNIDIPPDGLVGIIESNLTLATRYQVCGAATRVKATKQSTVPFRIINPTKQPVTIYRCTNLGQFSSYEELHIVSVLGTHNVVEDKSHRASLLLESLDLSNSDLDEKQQAQLNQLLHDNHDIFALNDDELGHTSLVEHHIDTGDSRPIYRQPYRVSPAVRNSIDHHVQQMLDQGIIQLSASLWAAPVVLVRKKDGTECFCVDYRQSNKVTK